MTADEIISFLDLAPHPEGGHWRQTWNAAGDGRATGSCIYFLLKAGERSHWHRLDADEIWHFYAGAPLIQAISKTIAGPKHEKTLGPDLLSGQSPQLMVPKDHWQTSRSTGEFTLVGCTVSPGFEFSGFELAEPGFDIP